MLLPLYTQGGHYARTTEKQETLLRGTFHNKQEILYSLYLEIQKN